MNRDIAGRDVVVRVLQDPDLPAAIRRFDLRLAAARQFQLLRDGGAVQRFHLRLQRAARLFHDARHDGTQPLHIAWVQVDVKHCRRQRGVVQRLQTRAHIAHDFEDDLPRGRGSSGGGTVHSRPAPILAGEREGRAGVREEWNVGADRR